MTLIASFLHTLAVLAQSAMAAFGVLMGTTVFFFILFVIFTGLVQAAFE